jgi:Protein of unknown function (DUF2794)
LPWLICRAVILRGLAEASAKDHYRLAERGEAPLSEDVSEDSRGGWAMVSSFPQQKAAGPVAFDRHELQVIMNLYGRMVAAGEWRDYAMDFLRDKAVFSIFRRTSEMPLYRIEKTPELRGRQGMYSVHAPGGLIMRRGQELAQVLRAIDKPVKVVAV